MTRRPLPPEEDAISCGLLVLLALIFLGGTFLALFLAVTEGW